MQWQGPHQAAKSSSGFWAMVAQMIGNSNFRNPSVPTRSMPVGMPQPWQPPITSYAPADATLTGAGQAQPTDTPPGAPT